MRERIRGNVTTGLLVLFVLLFFSTVQVRAEGGPKIEFKQDSWDFGTIKEGQIKTHVFTFQNSGDAVLEIKRVRTSCGCAAALVSKRTVGPNQRGELKVTFNSRGYEENVAKYIYVESNDPNQPVVQLLISAYIEVPPRPKIDLAQYSMDVGLILEGEEITALSVIKNQGERELRVSFSHRNASYYSEGKELNSGLRIPARRKARVKINIPSPSKTGLIREYILLKSNDPRRPNLSLYISGYMITKKQLKKLFKKYEKIIR